MNLSTLIKEHVQNKFPGLVKLPKVRRGVFCARSRSYGQKKQRSITKGNKTKLDNYCGHLPKVIFCLIWFSTVSQAKSTWEVAVPADTSKKTSEAAAEVGPSPVSSATPHHRLRPAVDKSRNKRNHDHIGKRRIIKPSKKRRSKGAFSFAFSLVFFSLFILGLLAWFGSLALWILGIFHFLGIFALFGAIFLADDWQGLVLIIFSWLVAMPMLAILGLLSFGLTFFSWGAIAIGSITAILSGLLLLAALLGFGSE